jgi:hypothetical protein
MLVALGGGSNRVKGSPHIVDNLCHQRGPGGLSESEATHHLDEQAEDIASKLVRVIGTKLSRNVCRDRGPLVPLTNVNLLLKRVIASRSVQLRRISRSPSRRLFPLTWRGRSMISALAAVKGMIAFAARSFIASATYAA